MEQGLITYIKNMFAMDEAPTWNAGYEGLIFYDKTAKKWITGTNVGWKIIDRTSTTVSGIAPINWIDPFEYYTNTSLSGTYTTVGSGISISTDNTTSTYGNYSMHIDTGTSVSGSYVERQFSPTLDIKSDYLSFDIKSDTIGSNLKIQCLDSITNYGSNFKSVILDIADNWGTAYVAVRSIEFYFEGSLLEFSTSDFTTYATTTYGALYESDNAFDTSLSKTGSANDTSWISANGSSTNQRLICVFNTPISFDTVVINNYHSSGGTTTAGFKNTNIYISSDEITSTTYGESISNSDIIFDGQIAIHVASDSIDDQVLDLIPQLSTPEIILHDVNITQLDTYQKEAVFIGNLDPDVGLGVLRFISTASGINYNVDNMRFDSDQETYWLDVCEYTTNSGVQDVYVTTSSELLATTTTDMVSYGNRAIKLSADTTTSGASICRTFASYTAGGYTAKSVILDIADAHGDDTLLGIRSVDFWFEGSKITNLVTTNFVAYSTSYFSSYVASYAFDTSDLKTGSGSGRQWYSAAGSVINQRLICVFNIPTEFDEIRINNAHEQGAETNRGANNVKIHISTDTITDTTYDTTISNSTLIFDGQFDEHVASDIEDSQTLEITSNQGDPIVGTGRAPSTNTLLFDMASNRIGENLSFSLEHVLPLSYTHTAKSFILDVADNWGDSSWVGVRSIDFWYNDSKITLSTSDFSSYATSEYSSQYHSENLFDTSISKTGSIADTTWMSQYTTNMRVICVFNSEQYIDEIRVNNLHSAGGLTTRGAKNVKAYFSTDTITDTTYNASISNSTLVYDGQFEQHSSTDTEDEQILTVSGTGGGTETKNMLLDVVGINRFRNYSMDVSNVDNINKICFTIKDASYDADYYIDNIRFY